VHVLATLLVIVVLNAIGLAVAGGFFVDFVNEHGPAASEIPRQSELEPAEAEELAQRFAPVLRMDSRELFVPIRQAAYVRDTQLKEEEGRFSRIVDASPALDTLPAVEGTCLHSRGCFRYLDVRGVEPDPPTKSQRKYGALNDHLIRAGERPTVHWQVTRYDDTGEYAVQYWFLYLFNFRLNEHESDWEQITVRLDEDKKPVDAFYSAHSGGETATWDKVRKDGEHPVVFPALGSHANYFGAGQYRVKIVCKRLIAAIAACFRGRRIIVDLADGNGDELRPDSYALVRFAGPVFDGSYGSGNYVVLTRKPDILADPRARPIYADPLGPLR